MCDRKDYCEKCGATERLTRHHVYPRRHFKGTPLWKNELNDRIITLCRKCHMEGEDSIEQMIPEEEMPFTFYEKVVLDFLEVDTHPIFK